jgi:hypothetical protein
MKSKEEIAQWIIDNRYPKSENEKTSDFEMYHFIIDEIEKLLENNKSKMIKLNKKTYTNLITADILKIDTEMKDSLEKEHIKEILNWSIDKIYKEDGEMTQEPKPFICTCIGTFEHHRKLNCFPYGDNCEWDECTVCGKQLNYRVY